MCWYLHLWHIYLSFGDAYNVDWLVVIFLGFRLFCPTMGIYVPYNSYHKAAEAVKNLVIVKQKGLESCVASFPLFCAFNECFMVVHLPWCVQVNRKMLNPIGSLLYFHVVWSLFLHDSGSIYLSFKTCLQGMYFIFHTLFELIKLFPLRILFVSFLK